MVTNLYDVRCPKVDTKFHNGPDPLKTESPQEIHYHKKEIKVRGRTANWINQETEEGGCISVQAMDS